VTRFVGNTYSNIALGVGDQSGSGDLPYRGNMITLLNVLHATFVNENFTNIGAFTHEQLE
jgi:hypothetical protein